MKNILNKMAGVMMMALPIVGTVSCTDKYMEDVNTDDSKTVTTDPNTQLTTGLLQTYGDFSMMDTYRSYVTGFTQHFAGGWNVTNYAGSTYRDNDQMSLAWNRLYSVSIKNLVDAIYNSKDKPNVNAALRIHRVYLMAVLTDLYGDVPCSEAGLSRLEGIAAPKYDKQQDIYHWFFTELEECINQFDANKDIITGDVTSLEGDINKWKKYANTLRLRYAMRISDVEPETAKKEFIKALNASCGFIESSVDNAYVKYINGPFTLYDGARDLDFRVNALGEILYGQDPTSPTFVCATLYDQMLVTEDPRLYRICRHYLNVKRSEVQPDDTWNVDVTDEVRAYQFSEGGLGTEWPCNFGAAWYNNWVSCPGDEKAHLWGDIPTLQKLVNQYPSAGFDANNCQNRMMRPFLSIKLEKPECPGVLITSAEVKFLLAEAALLGWVDVDMNDMKEYYKEGVRESMMMLNEYYQIDKISTDEFEEFIAKNPLNTNAPEAIKRDINTQAWILHMLNPNEAWANLRRSDYPILVGSTEAEALPTFDGFTYDSNRTIPLRLEYPALEAKYNSAAYKEAISRAPLNGKDDWHQPVWWDVNPGHVQSISDEKSFVSAYKETLK